MRKKLSLLVIALALTAAAAVPAPASACVLGFYVLVCPGYTTCCPNGRHCVCQV